MFIEYSSLPHFARRKARKLAKELLSKTSPPKNDKQFHCGLQLVNIRAALASYTLTRKKLHAALVYSDGAGHWWGDLVFQKDNKGFLQIGTMSSEPLLSPEDATATLHSMIASLNDENHPFAADILDIGMSPEDYVFLRVQTKLYGNKFMLFVEEEQQEMAAQFVQSLKLDMSVAEITTCAAQVLISHAELYSDAELPVVEIYGDEEVRPGSCRARQAAGFLISQGILNVDTICNTDNPKCNSVDTIH